MAYTPRFGTAAREALYARDALAAHKAGRGPHPICVHCDLPVTPGQPWDACHVGAPACFGGKVTRVGHRPCNQRDNAENVTPMAAKAAKVFKRHVGITGPGLGRHPLPGGRRSPLSKSLDGPVKPRLTHAEKHAAAMARRYPFGIPGQPGA